MKIQVKNYYDKPYFVHGAHGGGEVTVQILDEEGYLVECNHAGADIADVYTGSSDPADTTPMLCCDKCEAVYVPDGIDEEGYTYYRWVLA